MEGSKDSEYEKLFKEFCYKKIEEMVKAVRENGTKSNFYSLKRQIHFYFNRNNPAKGKEIKKITQKLVTDYRQEKVEDIKY